MSAGLWASGLDSSSRHGMGLMCVWCSLFFQVPVYIHIFNLTWFSEVRGGGRIYPFYRKGKRIPQRQHLVVVSEVRRASTHWLLSLTLSCAALRVGLNLDGGRGSYFMEISGWSLFLCSDWVSLPPSNLPGDLPGWIIHELSVSCRPGCAQANEKGDLRKWSEKSGQEWAKYN